MDSFVNYMDKIKAEDKLKENTIKYVNEHSFGAQRVSGKPGFKRLGLIAASAAICTMLATGAFAYCTPVNYLSVDINPSVELGVNIFGIVVKADGLNEDGHRVLKSAEVKNRSVKNAVSSIVTEAANEGYIADDGSTVIAVTSESNDADKAKELETAGEAGANNAVSAKNILAVVYADCSDLTLRTEAKELGISPGKYKVIRIMKSLDPSISASDYKDAKMTELIVKADELYKAYKDGDLIPSEDIALKDVSKAADKAKNPNNSNQGAGNVNQGQSDDHNNGNGSINKNENANNGAAQPAKPDDSSNGNGSTQTPAPDKGSSNSAKSNPSSNGNSNGNSSNGNSSKDNNNGKTKN